jgi:hypothetical protein
MNFPNKKMLYDTSSIINAISSKGGQYGITIIATIGTTEIPIRGILKDAISFGVDANWSELTLENIIESIATSNPLLQAVNTYLDFTNAVAGSSFVNTGIFSRLFYKASGRLEIAPNFRVFDFDASGICGNVAKVLSSLCIPTIKESTTGKKFAEDVVDISKDILTSMDIPVNTGPAEQLIQNAKAAVYKIQNNKKTPSVLKHIIQNSEKTFDILANGSINWTDAPNPVSISIGNWLTLKQAVITSTNFAFSYECTKAGPIYVDVALKLRTLENLAIGTNGDLQQIKIGGDGNSRVSINGSNRVFA